MNWKFLRPFAWLDTRARFAMAVPRAGRLLDLGTSDGATLRHIGELRPDLQLFGADVAERPEGLSGDRFAQVDLEHDTLPWPAGSFQAVTCMHLLEHLTDPENVFREATRLLANDGLLFVEVPGHVSLKLAHPDSDASVPFTIGFHDDPTHRRFVCPEEIHALFRKYSLQSMACGTSRNWLFAAAWPLGYRWMRASRRKYTAFIHFVGWSYYAIARRPGGPHC